MSSSNIITSIGNTVAFINLKTSERNYFTCPRSGGIGAITVHPSLKYFAIAETNLNSPNIYIYEFPSLKLYRILRKGTTQKYSALSFNTSGSLFVSVGSDPDCNKF